MSQLQQPLPSGGHKREEVALIEIEHTTISSVGVGLLLAFFLTAITAVPIAELAALRTDASARRADMRGAEGLAIAWSHMSIIPDQHPRLP